MSLQNHSLSPNLMVSSLTKSANFIYTCNKGSSSCNTHTSSVISNFIWLFKRYTTLDGVRVEWRRGETTLAASSLNLGELRIGTWDPDLHHKCTSLQQRWVSIRNAKSVTVYLRHSLYAFLSINKTCMRKHKAMSIYLTYTAIQKESATPGGYSIKWLWV